MALVHFNQTGLGPKGGRCIQKGLQKKTAVSFSAWTSLQSDYQHGAFLLGGKCDDGAVSL
jgi:hypothetical protein